MSAPVASLEELREKKSDAVKQLKLFIERYGIMNPNMDDKSNMKQACTLYGYYNNDGNTGNHLKNRIEILYKRLISILYPDPKAHDSEASVAIVLRKEAKDVARLLEDFVKHRKHSEKLAMDNTMFNPVGIMDVAETLQRQTAGMVKALLELEAALRKRNPSGPRQYWEASP